MPFRACVATALWLACVAAHAAGGGCVIVFGQGRNMARDDEAANTLWDGVNVSFNAHVASAIEAAGQRVLPLVAHVSATDVAANIRQALQKAAEEGCARIVETTVFADYDSRTLVARLRAYAILGEGTGQGAGLRIGPVGYVNERNFDLLRTTLDRVKPGLLGAEMAAEMLRQQAGPAEAARPAEPEATAPPPPLPLPQPQPP